MCGVHWLLGARAVMRWLVMSLLLVGCAGQSSVGRARVLNPGVVEGGGSLEAGIVGMQLGPGPAVWIPTAVIGGHLRAGVVDGVELGARAWALPFPATTFAGGSVDMKVRLFHSKVLQPLRVDGSTDVALVVHRADIGGAGAWGVGAEWRPLMIGISDDRTDVTLQPRVGVMAIADPTINTTWTTTYGVTAAWRIRITDTFAVVPEAHFNYAPVGWNGTIDDKTRTGATLMSVAVGAVWGG